LRFDGAPFITDGGNYILDCAFGRIESADMLQRELDGVVGVIEHGLFIGMASLVLILRRREAAPSEAFLNVAPLIDVS
jgi:ribose 5-phosphate isomerase